MVKKYLVPDWYFDDVYFITPEFLSANGIKALICDIDNTLEPYEEPVPTKRLLNWIRDLDSNGIKFAFVSNNNSERVELFNRELGYFAKADSGKPSTKALKAAVAHMNVPKENTVMLGDQVFTDVFAGKRMGLRAILVKPIRDKKTLFFRFKRWLEIPVLKKYARIHKNDKSGK